MNEFAGCYRAQFLSADALGNVLCTVPAVTGNVPVKALSADLTISLRAAIKPGDLGWVMFEGDDPSTPVWIGTSKPLDPVTAWTTYTAFDVFFDIAGYNPNNRTAFAEYRLDGDMCDMRFTYQIGTTTGWPAHYVRIKTPFNMAAGIIQRIPVGHVIAYDASTGLLIHGRAIMYSGDVGGTYLWGPRSFTGTGYSGSTENYWNQFNPAWPLRSGLDAAEFWAANDQIMGTLRFRAKLS